MSLARCLWLFPLVPALASCSNSDPEPEEAGVGHIGFAIPLEDDRDLVTEVWYPARPEADDEGSLVDEFFQAGADENMILAELFEAAPASCVRRETGAFSDAEPIEGTYPLVIASHCHECIRQEFASTAERLASEGIVVVAIDHPGNTLFDELAGGEDLLGGDYLQVRAADVSATLDYLETQGFPGMEGHGVELDFDHVGVLGHSFGAATAGLALQEDPRFIAGMAIAAPFESPVLPGVSVAAVDEPVLWLLAQEDNSITELGNQLIRMNHESLPGPSWLVEVADTGHWSFSDIAGLTDQFAAGCGDGTRQTDPGASFAYADNEAARDLAATLATLFFRGQLLEDSEALAALEDVALLEQGGLTVSVDARTN